MTTAGPLLSANEVADYIGVSLHRVRRLIADASDPLPRVGRRMLFRRESVDAWLDRNAVDDGRRYPLEPLLALLPDASDSQLAEQLRVSVQTVRRLRQRGLSVYEADDLACRVDLHPGVVWSDWLDRPAVA